MVYDTICLAMRATGCVSLRYVLHSAYPGAYPEHNSQNQSKGNASSPKLTQVTVVSNVCRLQVAETGQIGACSGLWRRPGGRR